MVNHAPVMRTRASAPRRHETASPGEACSASQPACIGASAASNTDDISPPVGVMSSCLNAIAQKGPLAIPRAAAEGLKVSLPGPVRDGARRAWVPVTGTPGGTLFEEFGFDYIGRIDGHDMGQLLATLRGGEGAGVGPGADPLLQGEG